MMEKELLLPLICSLLFLNGCQQSNTVHLWEKQELTFEARNHYDNPYTDVELWVRLQGPDFDKKVYGFWDGDNIYKVRLVATRPGAWSWTLHSNVEDPGFSNRSGSFSAVVWTDEEIADNPNRRGFLRATANGHALNYGDGTPFFYIADTWWAASTWRFPFKGAAPEPGYVPVPGMGFEEALQFRKNQGYNGITMITSFPSWQKDGHEPNVISGEDIPLRRPWVIDGKIAVMADENGNVPFKFPGRVPGFPEVVPDFDRINPDYFRNLDKKMEYLSEIGFIPFLEAVRRDHGPAWKHYYDWPVSYIRYVQYLVARYGCYNIIFSGVHLDTTVSLPASDWNEVLTAHYSKYGHLPFGQPYSTNITRSTYLQYGHGDEVPWLTMHGVGNYPRDHRVFALLEEIFHLPGPYPALNNEPFYPYSPLPVAANVHGDQTANARACAWGSVLNGALAGHIYGTHGYYITTGDPPQQKPYIWEALNGEKFFDAGDDMRHLKEFMLSEGPAYQDLVPCRESLDPNQISDGLEEWYLSGWSHMMRTQDARLVMLYFEVDCPVARVSALPPGILYEAKWFSPSTGVWTPAAEGPLKTDPEGYLQLPDFPGNQKVCNEDWAMKLKRTGS